MAEHECRYSGFSGGKRLCPVCLNEEPTAQGEDHGNDQVQESGAEGQESGEGQELDVNDEAYESTDVDEADRVEDQPEPEDEPEDEPEELKPRRRR